MFWEYRCAVVGMAFERAIAQNVGIFEGQPTLNHVKATKSLPTSLLLSRLYNKLIYHLCQIAR